MDAHNKIHLLDREPGGPGGASPAARHLTDAQFTDLLLGAIPPAVTAHLEACPACAQEAQRVSGAIGSFSEQSRLWAESRTLAYRSAQRGFAPQPAHQPLLSGLTGLFSHPVWSAAAAALFLAAAVGIGLNFTPHRGTAVARQQPAGQPASEPAVQLAEVEPAYLASAPVASSQSASDQAVSYQPMPNVPAATLKADNDLLSAIDGELSADAAPPARLYGLQVAAQPVRSRSTKRVSN